MGFLFGRRRPKSGPYSGWLDPLPPPASCHSHRDGQHRWTIMSSRRGYTNCRCGATCYTG